MEIENNKLIHYIPSENIKDDHKNDDLICFVCMGISFKPIYLKCCDHLICFDCVKQYITNYTKCPLCKSNIKFDKPSRIILRMFEKLKFQCKKCELEINYDDYFPHMINCEREYYNNIDFCKECKTLYSNLHDCNILYYGNHNLNIIEAKFFIFLSKKRILKRNNSNISCIIHNHSLNYTNIKPAIAYLRYGWECDTCSSKFDKNVPSYYCVECNIDICKTCIEKLSRSKKKNLDLDIHHLSPDIKYGWKCDLCRKSFEYRMSLSCSECRFYACLNCFIKN